MVLLLIYMETYFTFLQLNCVFSLLEILQKDVDSDTELQIMSTGAMVTVPIIIVILMFVVSILLVYLLYTKGKGCTR